MQSLEDLRKHIERAKDIDQADCHATASRVCEVFAGVPTPQCPAGTRQQLIIALASAASARTNAVFRVDVPQLGHSFAVVQSGEQILLLQSWVGSYSLSEWLAGAREELAQSPFLPKKGACDHRVLATWLGVLADEFAAGREARVLDFAFQMFCPLGPRRTTLQMKLSTEIKREPRAFDVKFSRHDF